MSLLLPPKASKYSKSSIQVTPLLVELGEVEVVVLEGEEVTVVVVVVVVVVVHGRTFRLRSRVHTCLYDTSGYFLQSFGMWSKGCMEMYLVSALAGYHRCLGMCSGRSAPWPMAACCLSSFSLSSLSSLKMAMIILVRMAVK